ncbi:MAG: hypothetical protein ACPGSO_05460 [Vicingaceae bacterium]
MTLLKNIITTSLFIGVFTLHPSLNKGDTPITSLQHFVYGNSLNISTNNNVNKHLLEVKWLCETQTEPCNELVIFRNGIQVNKIPSVKGNQKLVVFYNKTIIGEIPQHKTAENQAHDYNLSFSKIDNQLVFKGEIIGPSSYRGKSIVMASI